MGIPRKAAEELSQFSVFQGFSVADLERIWGEGTEATYTEGTVLIEEGKLGQEAYFILEGEVTVKVPDGDIVLGAGDVLGEMALLGSNRRRNTCTVRKDLRTFVINRTYFDQVMRNYPLLERRIRELIAARQG